MDNLTVIVLAAGGGTRMKSKTMKVLHPIGGRSMIGHVLTAVQAIEPQRIVAVVGHQREQVGPHIQELCPTRCSRCRRRRTAPATRCGWRMEALGTTPSRHRRSSRPGTPRCCAGRAARRSPTSTRRRSARSASCPASSPTRSATAGSSATTRATSRRSSRRRTPRPEQREIAEINSGILAFDAEFLLDALPRIGNDNAKGEYYLTDTVQLARDAGLTVGAHADRRRDADRGRQRPRPARRARPRAQPRASSRSG